MTPTHANHPMIRMTPCVGAEQPYAGSGSSAGQSSGLTPRARECQSKNDSETIGSRRPVASLRKDRAPCSRTVRGRPRGYICPQIVLQTLEQPFSRGHPAGEGDSLISAAWHLWSIPWNCRISPTTEPSVFSPPAMGPNLWSGLVGDCPSCSRRVDGQIERPAMAVGPSPRLGRWCGRKCGTPFSWTITVVRPAPIARCFRNRIVRGTAARELQQRADHRRRVRVDC